MHGEAPLRVAATEDPWPALLHELERRVDARLCGQSLRAVAHRIVHGGDRFQRSKRLDPADLEALAHLVPLAPLHQPHNLAGVHAVAVHWPALPQVGCFDTGFFADLPEEEVLLPLPSDFAGRGIRRYGFHGLSYRHSLGRLQALCGRLPRRVIMAHLGNGSSMCAVLQGRPVATSMGFSALDGLMMGTRTGSIDPGVLLHLWGEGWSHARVERLLYQESGLKGVSGLAADLRTLRTAEAQGHAGARRAIALYCHRAQREAGAMAGLLQGVDAVVFTGGIGEHDAGVREAIATAIVPLGLELDKVANGSARGDGAMPLHREGSPVEAWVIPADEGRACADDAFALTSSALDCH